MFRRPTKLFALFAAAVLAFAPAIAEAAAGGGRSQGSRGARTLQSAPATPTTPNAARPLERSATTPQQAQRAGQPGQAAQQQSWFQRNPMMAGLLGGMLGAGLIGMLMGGGFNFGEGFAGFMGLLLQVALLGGIAFLVMRFIRSRREASAQPAYAGAAPGAGNAPIPDVMARGAAPTDLRPNGAGGGGGGAFAPQAKDEIGLEQQDFETFEQRLVALQAAWTAGDLAALKRVATPEMVGYLSEDLSANASRGVENRVEDVTLDQGDLAEAWQEGATQYATVAMRWSAIDTTVKLADGQLVEGSRETRREHTEVWTFMRSQGGDWILSAIQQV
jgi:predicted lipid-binding transport protein (Tim44 family)